jgi:hypothetical protein
MGERPSSTQTPASSRGVAADWTAPRSRDTLSVYAVRLGARRVEGRLGRARCDLACRSSTRPIVSRGQDGRIIRIG